MPRLPDAGCFWHSKAVPARSRQLLAIMFPPSCWLDYLSWLPAELTKGIADRDNLHLLPELEAR
jgi:hypothetical protein